LILKKGGCLVRLINLGIDESNHGLDPEIFVGVYSRIKKDIELQTKLLGKPRPHRIPSEKAILEYLNGRSLSHLVIDQDIRKKLGADYGLRPREVIENVKVFAISELISDRDKIGTCIVDGGIRGSGLEKMVRIFKHNNVPFPQLFFEGDGDRRRKLVNMADFLAYRLFTYYRSLPAPLDKRFQEYKTPEPNMEMYQDLLLGRRNGA